MGLLVEKGTFLGDTVRALRREVERIVSVELSEELHARALARFADAPDVELLEGDSGAVLGSLVPSLDQPALFWLDGHYSEGFTAPGSSETPVFQELCAVFDVVLVDDAWMFTGENGSPTESELRGLVSKLAPTYGFELLHDRRRTARPARRGARASRVASAQRGSPSLPPGIDSGLDEHDPGTKYMQGIARALATPRRRQHDPASTCIRRKTTSRPGCEHSKNLVPRATSAFALSAKPTLPGPFRSNAR